MNIELSPKVVEIMRRAQENCIAYRCAVCNASVTEKQQADMPEWRSVNLEVCLNDDCVSKSIARLAQTSKIASQLAGEIKRLATNGVADYMQVALTLIKAKAAEIRQ